VDDQDDQPELPVILLTCRESPDAALVAAGLQVDGYFQKTTTSGPDLVNAVEQALGGAAPI